jgi:hypothetical protein
VNLESDATPLLGDSPCSAFVPRAGSLWLVVVECRYNVVAVCVSGKGFYIPGQEPCWGFSHVAEWVREITVETHAEVSRNCASIQMRCNACGHDSFIPNERITHD